jgi:hypothetical protein
VPAGAEPKQKPYGAWTVGKDGYPAPSRFAKHGGFASIREAARTARSPRRRPAAPAR